MPTIDFFCWDCGAPFVLTLDALGNGEIDPSCPVCDSLRIGADYESLVKWYHDCGCSREQPRHAPSLPGTAD